MIAEGLCIALATLLAYGLFIAYPSNAFGTRPRSDLKGPKGYPLLGNTLEAIYHVDVMQEWFLAMRRKHGMGSSMTIFNRRFLDVSVPSQLEYVQKTNFSNYVKGETQTDMMQDALGQGIFATDGRQWTRARKAMSHAFTASTFKTIITASLNSNLATLDSILTKRAQTGKEFDLQALFFAFTLSTFTQIGFGQDIGSLTAESDHQVPFAEAFDFAQYQIMARLPNPLWRFFELFSADGRKMRSSIKVMDDFAYDIIDGREPVANGDKAKDLLGLLMGIRDEEGKPIGKKELRDHVLNAIIAGRDTSAQALSWTMFRLLSDPKLIEVLREEIDRLGELTYENYKEFVQVHAAFNEGLRLHPSVPKNTWQALGDDQIPGGPKIEKGDWVRWSDWQMARDPEIWGEDCCEYKPSRWIDEKGAIRHESHYKFHVFNAGARLCLGMNLAIFESIAVLVAIFRSFDLKFAPEYLSKVEMLSVINSESTPRYAMSLTLPMKEPLRVIVSSRNV